MYNFLNHFLNYLITKNYNFNSIKMTTDAHFKSKF